MCIFLAYLLKRKRVACVIGENIKDKGYGKEIRIIVDLVDIFVTFG